MLHRATSERETPERDRARTQRSHRPGDGELGLTANRLAGLFWGNGETS